MKTKAERREQKRITKKRKWVKHGMGKWKPKDGLSKVRKKYLAKKIRVRGGKK